MEDKILSVEFFGRKVIVKTLIYGKIASGTGMMPVDTIVEKTYLYDDEAYQFKLDGEYQYTAE